MGRRKKDVTENVITEKEMGDKYVSRYEVLEQVKELLLLPGTELISTEQLAEYYEVSVDHIKKLYGANRAEIDSDGTMMLPKGYYSSNGSVTNAISVKTTQTAAIYTFEDGKEIKINNRGLKAFSKRAALRIGMLLQQSSVAKEVRTQLLNIEEKVENKTKVADVEEEQALALALGRHWQAETLRQSLSLLER